MATQPHSRQGMLNSLPSPAHLRKQAGRIAASARRRVRRGLVQSPFADPASQRLIVHCGHHRCGTTWFNNVLSGIADTFGLRYQNGEQQHLRTRTEIFLQNDSNVVLDHLPPYVGSHMVRDPRDMVVSAYFFHLWTREPWALSASSWYGGRSYQEYLRSLPKEEGILAEMERSAANITRMGMWDYENKNIIELRYEEVFVDQDHWFDTIFRNYGFADWAIRRAMTVVRAKSFSAVSGRRAGSVREGSHLRSGASGQWQHHFTDALKELFKDRYQHVLLRLGYESHDAW